MIILIYNAFVISPFVALLPMILGRTCYVTRVTLRLQFIFLIFLPFFNACLVGFSDLPSHFINTVGS